MRSVRLYNAERKFVVAGVVPPFVQGKEAEVLVWGVRVFMLDRSTIGNEVLDYIEVFATALVELTD